ncbi:MAG: GNAT family N-acetyltransferase [Candidatus Bathyarchaeota archaeon]|jgi:ribosomal protein S18 acetylase RimI-like enzyme|nr:GNAT family N-acetyltransferase [Candidatus Bathyarchaeota archaeon]
MKFTIRDYEPIDEEEWLKCHALVYLGSNERILERNKPKYDGKTVELIALSNKKIVGFLDIELEETPGSVCYKKAEGNGMLWDIGVLPEFRRKGVATQLLNEGIKRGKKLGMKRLEAWSIEPSAWKFYEKYGFKKFFEYHHIRINNREKLWPFDKDGMHIVEVYAHIMPETDLRTIIEKYQPKEVLPCYGYELNF